jgi:membrane fusion protein, multidrug efflux system
MAVLDTQELQLRADAKAKQAAVDLPKINLGYTRITAPAGGEVSERDYQLLADSRPGRDWVATPERFVDPETGRLVHGVL